MAYGSIDTTFSAGNGFYGGLGDTCTGIAEDNNGNLYIVGTFNWYRSIVANGICGLKADGTINSAFNYGTGFGTGDASDIKYYNGKLYVTGNILTYDGVNVPDGLIRLNLDGSRDTTFSGFTGFGGVAPSGLFILIDSLNNKIYVTGTFTTCNGSTKYGIVRLNIDGSTDATFIIGDGFTKPTVNNNAKILQFDYNGKIVCVGGFTSYSGVTANRIIRLNTDGSIDTSFSSGTGFNGAIYGLAIDSNNKFVVAGQYTSYNGTSANRIIRLNSNGSIDTSFVYGSGLEVGSPVRGQGLSIDVNDKIYVTGNFGTYNGTSANKIVRLNSNGSIDTSFVYGSGFNSNTVYSFIDFQNYPIISGGFTGYTGIAAYNLIRLISNPIYPPAFCSNPSYTVSGSTCGNADGKITILKISGYTNYFNFYDFTLTDVWGNNYSFNMGTGEATGLTSNYYFLTATVKSAYWGYYGRDNCVFEWIKVEDSDNPAYLIDVSVKPVQCGPFDKQYGRIYYNVSGLTSGNTYSFYAFISDRSNYYSKTGITTTESFLLSPADAQCYWVLIRDDVSGCALLLDNRCVPSVPMFSLGGVKKLYLAKWSDDLDYNYWNTKDDDYFLEFEDTSFFTSTKLKEYKSLSGGTIQWYSLPIAPQIASVSQKLEKVPQGFIFTDTLTIAIAKGDATKWTAMANLINAENKWIYIVQDNDGFWWTGGYRHGARITAYDFKTGARGEDNGYQLTITAVSENKLLTNIDENYIINYVE